MHNSINSNEFTICFDDGNGTQIIVHAILQLVVFIWLLAYALPLRFIRIHTVYIFTKKLQWSKLRRKRPIITIWSLRCVLMSNKPFELFHSNNKNYQRNRPKTDKTKTLWMNLIWNPFIKRTIIKVNDVVGYVNSINKSRRNKKVPIRRKNGMEVRGLIACSL